MEEHSNINPILMDHFKNPRNMGEMENPDGVGEAQNPVCGDTMRLFIKVEKNQIVDAMVLTSGCAAAIASSSVTTEMIKGKRVEEAVTISNQIISEALGGLPPMKNHAAMLAEQAINAAVLDYRKKTPSLYPSPLGGEGHVKKRS
jgi:nitrogen fixation NifU-like protein